MQCNVRNVWAIVLQAHASKRCAQSCTWSSAVFQKTPVVRPRERL